MTLRLQPVLDSLRRVVTEPRSELSRWQCAARYAVDLARFGGRQLRRDNAPQMAGALAFRTLFGLVPVLVVGTILVRAFRGTAAFSAGLERLVAYLGMDELRVFVDPGDDNVPEASQSLGQWMLSLVNNAAESFNFAAIGWVGVVVLVYSAIGLMVTIENSFNAVYRATSGRSWTRRVPMYWTVLTLSPGALALTTYVNAQFAEWIGQVSSGQWLLSTAPVVWGFVVVWLLMFIVYKLVPNTSVSVPAALMGAFVTAVLLEIGRRSLGVYLQNAMTLRPLYGSLGLIPLFMFWVYLMWLVVLFGLEVSATLQMLGGRRPQELDRGGAPSEGMIDPAAVVLVMEVIAERFGRGESATPRAIAEATDLPESAVSAMIDRLVQEGLLHRLEEVDGAVGLARPPDRITAGELIDVGYRLAGGPDAARSKLLSGLREAQRARAAELTLSR